MAFEKREKFIRARKKSSSNKIILDEAFRCQFELDRWSEKLWKNSREVQQGARKFWINLDLAQLWIKSEFP